MIFRNGIEKDLMLDAATVGKARSKFGDFSTGVGLGQTGQRFAMSTDKKQEQTDKEKLRMIERNLTSDRYHATVYPFFFLP
jgi:hypothetical protein